MDNTENTFQYTYSAKEQSEIESIRKKYLPQEENKMEQLRKLHNSASQKARVWSLAIGVIGALVMGTGMSLAMTNFGEILGAYGDSAMLIGIVTGMVGVILVALAYPTYNRVLKKERQRIAPEILRLTDELMK